jgi:ComF family protein
MWLQGLRDLARGLADLAYPNSCLICDISESSGDRLRHGLCRDCHRAVTSDSLPSCFRCGNTIGPHVNTSEGCSDCRSHSLAFQSVYRLGVYEGRLRDAVLRMKSGSGDALSHRMGRVGFEVMSERLLAARIDLVVPVPLHWMREWARGHNQSLALAEEMAKGLGVTYSSKCLKRVRNSPQQLQPSASARRVNIRGAFRVRRGANLSGKRILLVDDVMTTGSTASEAA